MKKSNKKKINNKIILIVVISVMIILIGSTLAYLIISNKGSENEFITMDNIDIEYVDGSSIGNNDLQLPINENEVLEHAPKHEFSVRNNNNKEVYLSFKITDLKIDEEISNDPYLRYSLYHNDEKITVGSFDSYDKDKKELVMLSNYKQEENSTEDYQLYIYIKDNRDNQNHFLNKSINGKIKIEGYDKELPTLAKAILGENNQNVITDTPDFSKAAVSQEYYDTLTESTDPKKSQVTVENGLYQDTDSDGKTYYFRGHVENNYVKIPGLKWDNTDDYHKKGEDMLFRIVRINGDGTIRIVANGSIGKSEFNKDHYSEEYVGYTYKTRIGYEIGEKSNESIRNILSTDSYYFSDEVTVDRKNGGYTLVNPVLHTGEECFNNKELCEGKYTLFSDSTDKYSILYQITTIESPSNIKYNAYQFNGKVVLDSNSKNIDSTIKTYLDNWYKENMKEYDKILTSTKYCNDTTTFSINNTGTLHYGIYNRFSTPSFICPNTDKLYGGEYDLKIGLLSVDELTFAGAEKNIHNSSYYLNGNTNDMWLSTPRTFHWGYPCVFTMNKYGYIEDDIQVHTLKNVIPVLNLRKDVYFSKGNGTKDEPYILSIN